MRVISLQRIISVKRPTITIQGNQVVALSSSTDQLVTLDSSSFTGNIAVLPIVPKYPNLSKVFLNGVLLQYGIDYTINSNQLVWLSYSILSHWVIQAYII